MSHELEKVEKQTVEQTDETTWAGRTFQPAVDIWETAKALVIEADMPGVQREDVEIDLNDDVLTLSGRVKVNAYAGMTPVYSEYNVGNWYRRFTVGDQIDREKIGAAMKDGVLTVMLPKREKFLSRRITVS